MKTLFPLLIAAVALLAIGCSKDKEAETQPVGSTQEQNSATDAVKFSNIVISDDESAEASKTVFTKDTPEIFIKFGMNAPSGSKVKSVWICEESELAPPNTTIDEETMEIGSIVNTATFSINKPNNGWPAGKYRTDLYCNEELLESVTFTVE